MRWSILLYGCFSSHGRAYEFDVMAPTDLEVARKIRSSGMTAPALFAGRYGDRSFFGARELVVKYLDADHPGARDRARNLEFILGYVGAAGACLPSWAEISALDGQFKADLIGATKAVLAAGKPLIIDRPANFAAQFSGPQRAAAGQRWDQMLNELKPGADGVVFQSRDLVDMVRWESPKGFQSTQRAARWRGEPGNEPPRGCAVSVLGFGFLLGAAGLATVASVHSDQPSRNDMNANSTRGVRHP